MIRFPDRVLQAAIITVALVLPVVARTATSPAGTIPSFSASQRCPGDGSAEMKYDCRFLNDSDDKSLTAPFGGRAYRETWQGPLKGPMGSGSITLTVAADGTRTLETPWHQGPYQLRPTDLPDFESTLAKSRFSQWPVYNRMMPNANEVCVDGVATSIEAIVNNRYRLVLFDYCGGVLDENIASALDQLFVFAANLSDLRYPVNPDHPTYRGY